MPRKKSVKSLKNKLDIKFSIYIRNKYADWRGYVKCVTCNKTRMWNDRIDAGHFISRGKQATRYDERNVHPQCKDCNGFKSGNMINYYQFMENTYGREVIDELKKLGDRKSTRLNSSH